MQGLDRFAADPQSIFIAVGSELLRVVLIGPAGDISATSTPLGEPNPCDG